MPNASLTREIRFIHIAFRQLATSFGRLAPLLQAAPKVEVPANGQPRRKPRLSRQQRAALKLQGKYMDTMRGLKPAQRTKAKDSRRVRHGVPEPGDVKVSRMSDQRPQVCLIDMLNSM